MVLLIIVPVTVLILIFLSLHLQFDDGFVEVLAEDAEKFFVVRCVSQRATLCKVGLHI